MSLQGGRCVEVVYAVFGDQGEIAKLARKRRIVVLQMIIILVVSGVLVEGK